ncbi:HDOD domain-containing protein [Salinispira pacifica]
MPKQVDAQKVLQAARSGVPLSVKTYTLPHETEMYLEDILGIFLKEMGRDALKDPLAYCLRELAVNAKKANTKRVYFDEKSLDILNDLQYSEGMKAFKQDTLDNIQHYLEMQKAAGLYIKVVFHNTGPVLNLQVCNNSEITKREQIRVFDRIARSRAFDSLEEALTTVLDDSEGAGLGIVILILMLRKIGLDEDAFDIDVVSGETIASIRVPMSEVKAENLKAISQAIVKEIDALPRFPENIMNLQQLISDPDTEINEIARTVSIDPALTADLLKVVNSAAFMLPKKVDNIVEAVKLVGMRGLRTLLYSYGTQKILGNDKPETKALWRHSYRTAFYAYNLAKGITKKKDILDDVYVGGILHDMGKIIFSSVHPDLESKIAAYCRNKGIPSQLFEDLSSGANHSEIGAMIAQKWNFPDALVEAIKFHHDPHGCSPMYQDVVFTVYLANSLCGFQDGGTSFDQIDARILKEFGMESQEQFKRISERLTAAFDKEATGP